MDFRSDTVTRPTSMMREVMAQARVGDDYYHDDPTVCELEIRVAEMFGKEAALFTPSGTQSNLIAVMTHCTRGDAYIVGHRSHSYLSELGGASMVASVQPQVVLNQADGLLKPEDIQAAILPASILVAPVRMIALENTMNGQVLPLDYLARIAALARQHEVGLHLDGARVFNAACALDIRVSEIAQYFGTISFCLSKGLGTPAGSLLVGSRKRIEKARRYRQLLGGGMRQAGILAAAGLYALQNNVARLSEDHLRAKKLAEMLSQIPGVVPETVQTNMVFCDVDPSIAEDFTAFLRENGIGVSGTSKRLRWVTHLDIDDASLAATLDLLAKYSERHD
ncbi:MAG: low-specificity L-threonine aldolase [Sneathiella sp.]